MIDSHVWYWLVGSDHIFVFSSAARDYARVADASYPQWKANGERSTKIGSEAELGEVLAPYELRPAASASGVRDGYRGALASNVFAVAAFRDLFNHEDRMRATEHALVLNGRPPSLAPGQALAAIKASM